MNCSKTSIQSEVCRMEKMVEERSDITQQKRIIRKQVLAVRGGISAGDREQYDEAIREHVLTYSVYGEARVILAYASYQSEVDTTALIKRALADGKYVFTPKVSGDDMEFWRITAMEDLKKGYRGIPEPAESVSFPAWLARQCIPEGVRGDVHETENSAGTESMAGCGKGIFHVMMWMPGVVFDQARHRIGYGGGYYDRYLQRLACMREKNHGDSVDTGRKRQSMLLTTAALAYSCQVLAQIPYEAHDIRPDMLVTEEGVLQQADTEEW